MPRSFDGCLTGIGGEFEYSVAAQKIKRLHNREKDYDPIKDRYTFLYWGVLGSANRDADYGGESEYL